MKCYCLKGVSIAGVVLIPVSHFAYNHEYADSYAGLPWVESHDHVEVETQGFAGLQLRRALAGTTTSATSIYHPFDSI